MMTELIGAVALAASAPVAPVPARVETVTTDTRIDVDANSVWEAVRDVYAVDTRLVPGMVTRVERDGDVRKVTFANGYVVTERITGVDDQARRVSYAAFGGKATYHLATMHVVSDGPKGSRVIWRTEFLPADLRPFIEQNMRQGAMVMKRHLEAVAAQLSTGSPMAHSE